MKIDPDYTRETLVQLIRTNSVNPTLAPGAPGEREIAEWIAGSLRAVGLSAEIFEPAPDRTSDLIRRVSHCHRTDWPRSLSGPQGVSVD